MTEEQQTRPINEDIIDEAAEQIAELFLEQVLYEAAKKENRPSKTC